MGPRQTPSARGTALLDSHAGPSVGARASKLAPHPATRPASKHTLGSSDGNGAPIGEVKATPPPAEEQDACMQATESMASMRAFRPSVSQLLSGASLLQPADAARRRVGRRLTWCRLLSQHTAPSMQNDRLLANCAPHLDTLSDQDDYECMDMLAVATECERPLLLVMVQVFREADLMEALGCDDVAIHRYGYVVQARPARARVPDRGVPVWLPPAAATWRLSTTGTPATTRTTTQHTRRTACGPSNTGSATHRRCMKSPPCSELPPLSVGELLHMNVPRASRLTCGAARTLVPDTTLPSWPQLCTITSTRTCGVPPDACCRLPGLTVATVPPHHTPAAPRTVESTIAFW